MSALHLLCSSLRWLFTSFSPLPPASRAPLSASTSPCPYSLGPLASLCHSYPVAAWVPSCPGKKIRISEVLPQASPGQGDPTGNTEGLMEVRVQVQRSKNLSTPCG